MSRRGTCKVLSAVLLLAALLVSGCQGETPTPAPQPTDAAPSPPEKHATVLVRPADGGILALRGGAQIAFPPHAYPESTLATLRVVDDPPPAPIPRSRIGQAYEFSQEGRALDAPATLSLPVPSDLSIEQYELAAYWWNGRIWERVAGQLVQGEIKVGATAAGIYVLLGQRPAADATVTLAVRPGEPGRQTTTVAAGGEYRFTAAPAVNSDFVEARLALKLDTSGGEGQITADDTRDQTVVEAPLIFKLDPGQVKGTIPFTYNFEVSPGSLNVPLASTAHFYAVLTVQDSPAPTRRASNAVDFVQMVPIQVVGIDVIRPRLPAAAERTLRWSVLLNGQPLFVRPVSEAPLSLADVLALGGLGEYRITLAADMQGRMVPVSNEVVVRLAQPATATLAPVATTPRLPGVASATPTAFPFGTMPPTPTRRAPPEDRTPTPTPTPSISPTPTRTPTPTRPPESSVLWADGYLLTPGECTTLHWRVENIDRIYLNGAQTVGVSDQQVCPNQTTVYTLQVYRQDGTQWTPSITVVVQGAGQGGAIEFWADRYLIAAGETTTLRWRAVNVTAVYFRYPDGKEQGRAGEDSQAVSPLVDSIYELRVVSGYDTTILHVPISVVPAETTLIHFWSEQYTMNPGTCTTLHWDVQNVQSVYLRTGGADQGISGSGARGNICPSGLLTTTITAITPSGHTVEKSLRLFAGNPGLPQDEVVAQAVVRDVSFDQSSGAPHWDIQLDGINVLYKGASDCCQMVGTLRLTQTQARDILGPYVDFPVGPGQLVEFRARRSGNDYVLDLALKHYFKLRSG